MMFVTNVTKGTKITSVTFVTEIVTDIIAERVEHMATVLSFMNFKGGVGKTTNSVMMSYRLAKRGKRVLIIDMDPQANATTVLDRTVKAEKRYELSQAAQEVAKKLEPLYKELYDGDTGEELEIDSLRKEELLRHVESLENQQNKLIQEYEETPGLLVGHYLVDCLEAESLREGITAVTDNMWVIPNNLKSIDYADVLEDLFPGLKRDQYELRIGYLGRLIREIRDEYDYILIDVPPTISIYTDTAAYASDWIVGVLQTQTRSLEGAQVLVNHFIDFVEKYDLDLSFIGFLCVIQNARSAIDQKIEALAIEQFGEDMIFKTTVRQMERLKRYDDEGILDIDQHDKAVMKVYDALVDELEERLMAVQEV